MAAPCIFVSAAEASGDRYAAAVVRQLRLLRPGFEFFGSGGTHLAAASMTLRHRSDELAVTGLSEAAAVAQAALRFLRDSVGQLLRRRPRLALLVDYPGINLRLAWVCKRLGIPVLYYGAPQRWAWLRWRAAALADLVDQLVVTLPFESAFFRARGVNAIFVGHPLLDDLACGGSTVVARSVIGLFPGSRKNELQRHLPVLRRLAAARPAEPIVVAVGDSQAAAWCKELAPELTRWPVAKVFDEAAVALCASGTVSLELALRGIPLAVFYQMAPLSFALARRLVDLPHISLPNLILGRTQVPELLQDACTPQALSEQLDALGGADARATQREAATELRAALGEPGVAARVAAIAASMLR